MNCAWVTYVNDDAYLLGAIVLYRSLASTDTRFPFVIMVPSTFKPTRDIPPAVRLHRVDELVSRGSRLACARYASAINKVHAWSLIEFDLLCWLDSDMIVLKNIDGVFGTPLLKGGVAAASGCTCNYFKNEKNVTQSDKCPFLDPKNVYFNAGFIVLQPSLTTFDQLLQEDYDHPLCEQDTFNIFFKGKVTSLPTTFNYLSHLALIHPETPDDVRVFHFCYGKPWDRNILGLNQQYYDHWTETLKGSL